MCQKLPERHRLAESENYVKAWPIWCLPCFPKLCAKVSADNPREDDFDFHSQFKIN